VTASGTVELVVVERGAVIMVMAKAEGGIAEDHGRLDRGAWMRARAEGRRSVLDLISDAASPKMKGLVRSALAEGRAVTLDGVEIDHTSVALAFFIAREAPRP
jgi:hypothetical protein